MSELDIFLRANHADLVERAGRALARGEGLRTSVEGEMERFFDLLATAVETGSVEWFQDLLRDWVAARSAPAGAQRQSLVPVLLALKGVVWDAVRAASPPDEGLAAVLSLEPIFAGALQSLIVLEMDSVVADVEARLSRAQAHLEKLDKSKSNFISVAAHELKTPLTLIEGYTKMIADELAPDDFRHLHVLINGVNTGTDRLHDIVDDMVDVSMIDNEMLSLAYQPVWLRRLVEIVETDLEDVLADRRLDLTIRDFDDGGRATLADPERLYQVFRNVIMNAVKFTPDGGRINVAARQLPGFIAVTVTDTGIGIAPEHQHRIFDKFAGLGDVSLHSSGKTKFKGGGAGLGLAIARGIIEAHGGAIWCESPGYDEHKCPGSTFHIMVPARTELPKSPMTKLYGLTQAEVELIRGVKTA